RMERRAPTMAARRITRSPSASPCNSCRTQSIGRRPEFRPPFDFLAKKIREGILIGLIFGHHETLAPIRKAAAMQDHGKVRQVFGLCNASAQVVCVRL